MSGIGEPIPWFFLEVWTCTPTYIIVDVDIVNVEIKDGPKLEEWWGQVPLMVRKLGIDYPALGDSPQVIEGKVGGAVPDGAGLLSRPERCSRFPKRA